VGLGYASRLHNADEQTPNERRPTAPTRAAPVLSRQAPPHQRRPRRPHPTPRSPSQGRATPTRPREADYDRSTHALPCPSMPCRPRPCHAARTLTLSQLRLTRSPRRRRCTPHDQPHHHHRRTTRNPSKNPHLSGLASDTPMRPPSIASRTPRTMPTPVDTRDNYHVRFPFSQHNPNRKKAHDEKIETTFPHPVRPSDRNVRRRANPMFQRRGNYRSTRDMRHRLRSRIHIRRRRRLRNGGSAMSPRKIELRAAVRAFNACPTPAALQRLNEATAAHDSEVKGCPARLTMQQMRTKINSTRALLQKARLRAEKAQDVHDEWKARFIAEASRLAEEERPTSTTIMQLRPTTTNATTEGNQ